MIKVKVDSAAFRAAMKGKLCKAVPEASKAAAKRTAASWRELARRRLHSTAKAYMNAIERTDGTPPEVRLKGVFPNMLEKGFNSYDLKSIMLKSGKARMSKPIAQRLQRLGSKPTHATNTYIRLLKARSRSKLAHALVGRYIRIPVGEDKFRTLSWRSPSSSWWHRGFGGLKLAKAVRERAREFLAQEFAKRMK